MLEKEDGRKCLKKKVTGKKKCDLTNCNNKDHPLTEILSTHVTGGVYKVVRWCPVCGAIVVDEDFDGRTNPGSIMEMEIPEIYKERL